MLRSQSQCSCIPHTNKANLIQNVKQKKMEVSRIFLSHSLNERILSFLAASSNSGNTNTRRKGTLSLSHWLYTCVSMTYKRLHCIVISSVLKTQLAKIGCIETNIINLGKLQS